MARRVRGPARGAGAHRRRAQGAAPRSGRRCAPLPACRGTGPLLQADSKDEASLRAVAESTKVVISTVGPYILHGEGLVAACAAVGTSYVDLTGEPEFVDQMWLRHHEAAERSGARLVHSCGF